MQDIFLLWVLPIMLMIYFGWSYLRMPKSARRNYYGILALILLAALIYRHLIQRA